MRDGKKGKSGNTCTRKRADRRASDSCGGLTLAEIGLGRCGRISALAFEGQSLRRLIDLGFSRGAVVRCVGESPMGDPRAYEVRGAVVAIRSCDARRITVCEQG